MTPCLCMQVLVIFLGVHKMMWHRPTEVRPFAAAKAEMLSEGRHLHDAHKLGRPLAQLLAAAQVGLCCLCEAWGHP